MIAMLGEEADWRQAEKSTVREILTYGLQSKHSDVAVAQEFASVSFDGSPDRVEDFHKLGIFHQQLLDIHPLAASTAFTVMRKLSDIQIEECAKADEKEYQRLIKETNRLLSRYLRVKQCFTNVDHIWTDAAFSQYANGQLELQPTTRKATRKNLDAAMHTLRGLTAQMAAIAQREAESRTGHALQAVSIVLSGTAVLNFVKLVGDAYQLDLLFQLWIGIVSWVAISAIILLIGFRR
jgi:hypothetical protein